MLQSNTYKFDLDFSPFLLLFQNDFFCELLLQSGGIPTYKTSF